MIRMLFVFAIIFALVYGGTKCVQSLSNFQFESLLKEISFISVIAAVVMFLITTIIVLF